MPKPRYSQVSVEATPYYHCIARCVRRAFLCGVDISTGESYEHRRQWLENKLLELGEIFAIDICAYAIMSNHYHVVLHVNKAQVKAWSDKEVIQHWHQLFSGNVFSQRYLQGHTLFQAEQDTLKEKIECWRERLIDISWFMRVLNETIARRANKEDDCTGRFWEGRFKSQALLDEAALVACMAYVDLNPIRAGMEKSPDTSAHTSIRQRIKSALNHHQPKRLFPFVGNPRKKMPQGLPFRINDYLKLVEWTGRQICKSKRGAIDESLPSILNRLNFEEENWLYLTQHFESKLKGLAGSIFTLIQACEKLGYQRTVGKYSCQQYFP